MKKKYILSIPYIEYEEKCLEIFEDLAKEGWKLTKVGIFFVFTQTNHYYKHQIDSTPRNEEYNAVIEELGYEYVGSCGKINFYVSENPESPDLSSDQEVSKSILLNRYKAYAIFYPILMALILGPRFINFHELPAFTKVNFYLYPEEFISIILGITISLNFIFDGVVRYIKRKAILEDRFTYDHLHHLDALTQFLHLFHLLFIFFFQIFIVDVGLFYLILTTVLFAYYYLDLYVLSKAKTQEDQIYYSAIVFTIVGSVLGIISLFGNHYFPDIFYNTHYNYDLPTQDISVYAYKDNGFTHLITAQIDEKYPFDVHHDIVLSDIVYLECKNEKIASVCLNEMTHNMVVFPTMDGVTCYKDEDSLVISKDCFIAKVPIDEQSNIIEITTNFLNYFQTNQHFN